MSFGISESTRQQIAVICKKHKIRELSLFGSRARGDFSAESDFDFLVEFSHDAETDLLEFSRIQCDLEDLMEGKVDLVSKRGLKELIREQVLADATPIYEEA
jgi:predicted nucleotidyltransferase